MKKIVLGSLLLIPSNALAQAGWEQVGPAKTEAAICAASQSVRLDDRKTSPDIIARAGMRACRSALLRLDSELAAVFARTVPNSPYGEADPALLRTQEMQRDDIRELAIQAVLEFRVKRSGRASVRD